MPVAMKTEPVTTERGNNKEKDRISKEDNK